MNEQLKRCSICGSPAEKMWDLQEKLVRCTNRTCHNSLYSVYLNEWQKRPIEDELQARIAELEAEIRNWQDCYCEFETIAPDGKLKISVLDIYNRIAELNDRIAELEAERRWIPVSERLPEDGEVVWLWDGNNLGMGYYLVLSGCFMDRDTPLRRIKPTHWMPLPEPQEVKE